MTDPNDPPPRKKKRAKRPEPDYVIDPNKPNATIELETADLVSLSTGGLVEAKVNKTRELQLSDMEELREGMPIQDPKIIVDLTESPPKEQNVFVDLGGEPEEIAPPQQQALPAPPRASTPVNIVTPRAPRAPSPLPQEHRISDSIPVAPTRASAPMPVEPEPPRPAAEPIVATPINVQRVTATVPKVEVRRATSEVRAPKRGLGIVVLVYLLSAAALAVSIYFRWFA